MASVSLVPWFEQSMVCEIHLYIAFSLGKENTDPSGSESEHMFHSSCFQVSLTEVFWAVLMLN